MKVKIFLFLVSFIFNICCMDGDDQPPFTQLPADTNSSVQQRDGIRKKRKHRSRRKKNKKPRYDNQYNGGQYNVYCPKQTCLAKITAQNKGALIYGLLRHQYSHHNFHIFNSVYLEAKDKFNGEWNIIRKTNEAGVGVVCPYGCTKTLQVPSVEDVSCMLAWHKLTTRHNEEAYWEALQYVNSHGIYG